MKTKVGVVFGGLSVEHEVSVISALQAIKAMDENKYEAIPLYISKKNEWYTGESLTDIEEYKELNDLLQKSEKVILTTNDEGKVVVQKKNVGFFGKKAVTEIDVVFPVIHGTNGEDGSLQGMLEMLQIPYVGCDVFSSAVGMDKVMMKQILNDSGVPIVDYNWFYSTYWLNNQDEIKAETNKIGYPVIVKPANLGSSVGISKAYNDEELEEAINEAIEYSHKIVVEKMIGDLTEVNCSVVGDYEEVESSVLEEVLSSEDILTYEDKYQGGGKGGDASKGMESTNRVIPAEIPEDQTQEVQKLAEQTFKVLGCNGVSRIDFLIDKESQKAYVNEINTIPGSLSFYLWEPTGKDFTQLTDQLLQLALKRQREREKLNFSIDSNLFSLQSGGSKGKLNG
ncbi:D-alanine--D-alanine ligase family protein [Pontibacillus marinus]|uniref:D-alanine--D-alanine ligase n=1 Tax=Pontibacillus marinus BH030004 = DSM 16465 TaxID=1385511 RepID=A0A0A5I133_9BACI|nr:D-alanine--D-alanine ligase family protein [Pontibacillus marinus]KGX89557.1 D-alanine--D-alanine ligase [Pontibacillus marinus BH030004 = DSM 16465]